MKNEKETKSLLLASAKKEFMDKGYMQASLRSICKYAGVTTGALYFFFEDKEDVFASLVEEPLEKLYAVMNRHFDEEKKQAKSGMLLKADHHSDLEASYQIVHYLYQYYDEFQLILTKAQGSRFENCVDRFIEMAEKHYRILADKLTERTKDIKVDDFMIHWIAHLNIDIFVHMLTHEVSEEEALRHMKHIISYLVNGWSEMFVKPEGR